MNGAYLAWRVQTLAGPFVAFQKYFFEDILPVFGDLDARAKKVGEDYYHRIGSMPSEGTVDMADVADDAKERSLDWWTMMTSFRQTMLNLFAAGLFHLVEQQLASLSRDALFDVPIRDSKIETIRLWYNETLGIDLRGLPAWKTINEMRLVANTVKHGEGGSAAQLRTVNPKLFGDPAHAEFLREHSVELDDRIIESAHAPLVGEDFFITPAILESYALATEKFFAELADELSRRG